MIRHVTGSEGEPAAIKPFVFSARWLILVGLLVLILLSISEPTTHGLLKVIGYIVAASVLRFLMRRFPNGRDFLSASFWAVSVVLVITIWVWWMSQRAEKRFNAMTPAQHLKTAQQDMLDFNWRNAQKDLDAIPANAPERSGKEFRAVQQDVHDQEQLANAQQVAQAQIFNLRCGTQTGTGNEFMSLDNGRTWVPDDGRCMERVYKQRDEDAKKYSYWSTKLRVDTDMSQSWLNDEERVCTSYPDAKGRVATISCDANSHTTHNIPVTFWGGVDRGHPSTWRCRREKGLLGDDFVCWAID